MKNLHIVLLVTVLLLAVTAGAVLSLYLGKSPIIGTWHWESTSAGEVTLTGLWKGITFTFNSDGTFMASTGNNISTKGTWHLEGNKLTVEVQNVIYTYDIKFEDGNSRMVLTVNTVLGDAYITLVKE